MLAADFDRLPVQQWLSRLGATLAEDACGPQAVFPVQADALAGTPAQIVPLPDLGVIQVSGADAVSFLQGQLTNSVEGLDDQHWRWFGYCNAKGRMQLSALGIRSADTIQLICSRQLAAPLAKRLGMFVLRAKAKVTDVSAQHEVYGLRAAADRLPAAWGLDNMAEGSRRRFTLGPDVCEAMALPVGNALAAVTGDELALPRWLCLVPAGSAGTALWDGALRSGLQAASSAPWRATEVSSASARVLAPTYESFVPQMINFESMGGVDFKKGCYPGQEVVARSQYLGKLKRRMFVGWIPSSGEAGSEPVPAQDVWPQQSASLVAPSDQGFAASGAPTGPQGTQGPEPCGVVVLAGTVPGRGVAVLFESQIAAVETGGVGVRDALGRWQGIRTFALPYPLLEL